MTRMRLTLTVSALLMLAATTAVYAVGIDTTDKYAWGENIGWLNWGSSQGAVDVGTAELTGYVWGENIGWLSLNCSNTSSCGTVDYKVTRSAGVIAGYAWGENVGWVSFNCSNTASCGTVDYSVSYDTTTGEFSGYAWGENTGWIVMNCATTASCGTVDYKVKTATSMSAPSGGSFLPTSTPTASPSGTPVASPTATPTRTPIRTPPPTPSAFPTPSAPPPGQTPPVPPPSPSVLPPPPFLQRVADTLDGIAQQLFGNLCVGPVGVTACGATAMSSLAVLASFLAALIQSEWAAATFSLFQVIGLRKRAKVWGVVYDSATKHPVPLAKLELRDSARRVLETRYADRDGRYGFLTSPASLNEQELHVSIVVYKPGYKFPSSIAVSGTDYIVYENVYRGGDMVIRGDSVLNFNIPVDPVARGRLSLSGFGAGMLGTLGDRLLSLGFFVGLVSVPLNWYFMPTTKNLVIGIVFIVANAIRMLTLYRPYGMTKDALTGRAMPFSLVTLDDLAGNRQGFAVSDEHGRFILSGEQNKDYEVTAYTPANVQPQRSVKRRVRGLRRISTHAWITEDLTF